MEQNSELKRFLSRTKSVISEEIYESIMDSQPQQSPDQLSQDNIENIPMNFGRECSSHVLTPDCLPRQRSQSISIINSPCPETKGRISKTELKPDQSQQENQFKRHLYFNNKDLPRFFPLDSFAIGRWGSNLHQSGQLFLYMLERKFLFIVIYPDTQSEWSLTWELSARKFMKLFGKKYPFSSINSTGSVDFFGVVAFEVPFDQIGGLEYSNVLFKYSSRIAIECKSILKKCFKNIDDFLEYYKIEERQEDQVNKPYVPIISKKRDKLLVERIFPFQQHENRPNKQDQLNTSNNIPKLDFGKQFTNILQNQNNLPKSARINSQKSIQKFKTQQSFARRNTIDKNTLVIQQNTLEVQTIAAYFDDPVFHYSFKEIVNMPNNKDLLIHYEASLPSWATVLARYGYYKPCMRHFIRTVMIIVTLITFAIGMYDLYKNVPFVKLFLSERFGWFVDFIEDQILLRIFLFIGSFGTYISQPAISILGFVYSIITYILKPFMFFVDFIKFIMSGLCDILYPIYYIFHKLFKLYRIFHALFKLIADGLICVLSILQNAFSALYWMCNSIIYIIQWVFQSLYSIKSILSANTALLQEANNSKETVTVLGFIYSQIVNWGQSIIKKLFYGGKSIYNSIVYFGCELAKHKWSYYNTCKYFTIKYCKLCINFYVKYKYWIIVCIAILVAGLTLMYIFKLIVGGISHIIGTDEL